jgi:hypothetical protein
MMALKYSRCQCPDRERIFKYLMTEALTMGSASCRAKVRQKVNRNLSPYRANALVCKTWKPSSSNLSLEKSRITLILSFKVYMQLARTLVYRGCPVNLSRNGQTMNVKIRLGANLVRQFQLLTFNMCWRDFIFQTKFKVCTRLPNI